MKKRTKTIALGSVAVIAIGGIAYAAKGYQEHRKLRAAFAPEKIFEEIDTDADQAISLEELNQSVAKRFALSDADKDGLATKADIVRTIEENAPVNRVKRRAGWIADRLFIGIDLNNDGKVEMGEIENRLAKFHALADWNDDGRVEMAEMKRLRASFPGRGGRRHDKDDDNDE